MEKHKKFTLSKTLFVDKSDVFNHAFLSINEDDQDIISFFFGKYDIFRQGDYELVWDEDSLLDRAYHNSHEMQYGDALTLNDIMEFYVSSDSSKANIENVKEWTE